MRPADPWLAPSPDGAAHNWLDRDRFAPVVGPLRAEAVAALANASVLRLTAVEAARFAGRELPVGGEFFLLRGAAMGETHGSYSVSTFDGSVNVMHTCLGRPSGPVTHNAVVAALSEMPKAVYVNYGWCK